MKLLVLVAIIGLVVADMDKETCLDLLGGHAECNCYELKYYLGSLRSGMCQAGIKSGKIADDALFASSSWGKTEHSRKAHGAANARLDKLADGNGNGGWSAADNIAGEFIQVDLKSVTRVTGLILQGREGRWPQWVKKFSVQYSIGGEFKNVEYNGETKIFHGNYDQNSYAVKYFPGPIYARYVRIIAKEWHNHISLRFELITC